ncbi:ileS, partial [Symbiodinium sp. CCMP2456]
ACVTVAYTKESGLEGPLARMGEVEHKEADGLNWLLSVSQAQFECVDELPELPEDALGAEDKDLGVVVTVSRAAGHKCERCWVYSETVGDCEEHPTLCHRCADVVQELGVGFSGTFAHFESSGNTTTPPRDWVKVYSGEFLMVSGNDCHNMAPDAAFEGHHRTQKPVTLFVDCAMGGTVPKIVEDEKTKWAADHCLQINVERRDRQLQSVGKFGEQLHVCWSMCTQDGIRYQHFFVTDLVHTMEFLTTGLQVHSNALGAPYYVDVSFTKTHEVEHRMKQVCGSMAYSVSLRNCEHLARFIHSGSWVSYQMLQGSYLGSTFVQYMMDEHLKKSNCLPVELQAEVARRPLYSSRDYAGLLRYESSPRGLSRADHDAFNVLVVGPSGCGKSRLINLLFNCDVTESKGAAHSVTREMTVLSGQGKIRDSFRKVNIIDTIGLCDSHISASMVLELIKSSLRVNFAYIDQVVVICSGRIEAIHTENIKQILEWLRYKDYKYSFTFVYNKADLLTTAEREMGVINMCQSLQVQRIVARWAPGCIVAGDVIRRSIEPRPGLLTRAKCVATGFPAGQEPEQVIEEMCKVVDSAFSIVDIQQRIPVQESWCAIL